VKRVLIPYVLCILLIFLPVLFTACAPASWNRAKEAHRVGNMVGAVENAVQTLRQKPGYEKAIDFLEINLPVYYRQLEEWARRGEAAGEWDDVYDIYRRIQRISDAASSLPPLRHPKTKALVSFETRNVTEALINARNSAAEMHYQWGLRLEREGRDREAANAYRMAREYIFDYKDTAERYSRTRAAALQRIAVLPFDNLSGNRQFGLLGEIISDQLVTHAMSDRRNLEFLEFVTRERLDQLIAEQQLSRSGYIDPSAAVQIGKLLGIHAFVFGKVLSVITEYYPETREVIREDKEISQGRNQPNITVSATVTVFRRRATARIVSSYQIIDVESGAIVRSANLPQETEVVVEFARFRGDERALSAKSKALVDRGEQYPPPANELVFLTVERISKLLADEIVRFF
jgi:tetratricopeptide (TPR) repeat protein